MIKNIISLANDGCVPKLQTKPSIATQYDEYIFSLDHYLLFLMDTKPTQITRQWKLIRLLSESADGLTLDAIAEQLDTTPRTVNRDLAMLRDAGLPLLEFAEAHGRKRWKLEERPTPPFSYDEVASLYLGRRFLEPLTHTFLWDAADSALTKMRTLLGSQTVRYLDRLLSVFRATKIDEGKYVNKSAMIDALILGCEEQREVVIVYHSLAAKTEETYTIHPYELEISGSTVYVSGYSCKSQSQRFWKLDRMSSALATNTKFVRPKEANPVTSPTTANGPLQKVKIFFNAQVSRFVQEHRWHESEKITENDDGSLLVEYQINETMFLKTRLLSFGRHAEVIEPESLRDEMRKEIEEMSKRYYSNFQKQNDQKQ